MPGNIPDYNIKQITDTLIDKHKARKTGGKAIDLKCDYCLKPFKAKPWVAQRKDEVVFRIRKGWRTWHFCGLECQKKFRARGVYKPHAPA